MINMDCPGCGHHLRILDEYSGREGKCRYCKAPFFVPVELHTTPTGLKPKTEETSVIFDERPELPGVAILKHGTTSAIEDSIFAPQPESTATADLFEAHYKSSTHKKSKVPKHSNRVNYGLLALIILIVIGVVIFFVTQNS